MFDFSFGEMLVVALVALIVLGPERLPKAARFAGLWVRKARAQWYSVKTELESELASEELRRSLQDGKQAMQDAERQMRDFAADTRREIETDASGEPRLVKEAKDGRRALRLKGDAESNLLTQALADDRHFGPYMAIPGKDNGFDIEGLAVDGKRLLLGLRGPVLRGWSAVLEIAVEATAGHLRLVALDDDGTLIRKHFLHLEGLGIRDLHFHGDDLYILAGPTMVLDGDIHVFKWAGAKPELAANREPVRFLSGLESLVSLPHGRGTNRAEALCALPPTLTAHTPAWLTLYDAPGPDRKDGEYTVFGDLLHQP